MGWGDILFVRARTHMPKWNRRRFAPDRYSRDGFSPRDRICRTLRYRTSSASDCFLSLSRFPLPLSSPIHAVFFELFEAQRVSIFSLSLSLFVEKHIEPQRYKGCPRCVKSTFYTKVAYRHFMYQFSLLDLIPFHFRNAENPRICHEPLFFVYVSSSELSNRKLIFP